MMATSTSPPTTAATILRFLRNDGGNANHWLEILLIGTRSNRDGIGASLKLTSEGIRARGASERRHELYVGQRSANSFWSGQAH